MILINISDGVSNIAIVQVWYDTGRNWVARLASFPRDTTWNVDNGVEADGPTFQIAFDNLKNKIGMP